MDFQGAFAASFWGNDIFIGGAFNEFLEISPRYTSGKQNEHKQIPWLIFFKCRLKFTQLDLGVSKNSGTPKWMIYNGNPY